MKLGHVHLKVRDLQRAVAFYTGVFGLKITEIAGGRNGILELGQCASRSGSSGSWPSRADSPAHAVGLYHTAFEVRDAAALAGAYDDLRRRGVSFVAVDHGISWALYFDDPDGNGLEVYLDTRRMNRGRESWRRIAAAEPRNNPGRHG